MTEIIVPTLGESVSEATVATWFKKPGDLVNKDEMLCELETDKVTVEVPSKVSGTLREIIAPEGTVVGLDALLAHVEETESNAIEEQKSDTSKIVVESAKSSKSSIGKDVENAPSARKMMSDKNLAPENIKGSGRDGRIMKEDVIDFTNKVSEENTQGFSDGEISINMREERIQMSRMRQTIANRLKHAQNTAAMLTTYNEVDMTDVIDTRKQYKDLFEKKHGIKLGFMSFFIKACCQALEEIPEVNAEINGTEIIYKKYVNMSVAVGTPTGLVAPVIKDVKQMSFARIEKLLGELSNRARQGKLSIGEMQEGTFTISNGGIYGSLMSSPILNPPQSGILGMHKIQERPIAINGEIVIRPMMYLALSYDHRIVDGKGAVSFLVRVKECLEDPTRLLMDL